MALTTTNYNLNVTVSDNYEAPAITYMTLQGPNGAEPIEGKFNASANTFTFEVPYSVTTQKDLEDYKLFYGKTVGSTITFNGSAFPKSGAYVDCDADYIPDPTLTKMGAAITVTSNKGASQEKDEFYIVLDRAEGNTNANLKDFNIVNDLEYEDITRTYGAKVDSTTKIGTVDVKVYWTGYQTWEKLNERYGSTYTTVDPSAKLYYLYNDDTLHRVDPVVEDKENVAAANDPTGFDYNTDDLVSLVVLSEKAWVDLGKSDDIANWSTVKEEQTNFKEYDLIFTKLDAEPFAKLSAITLLDGSGWSDDLKIDVSNNKISGKVPYSFTSSTEEIIPIYMDYTTSDNAWVLSLDEGVNTIVM